MMVTQIFVIQIDLATTLFTRDGGCLATSITYSAGSQDITSNGFTEDFIFYGFDPNTNETFTIIFDNESPTDPYTVMNNCTATCGNGYCFGEENFDNCPEDCLPQGQCPDGFILDCADDDYDCCLDSWIGDGYCDGEDQQWGGDLTCYDNDGGDCDGYIG